MSVKIKLLLTVLLAVSFGAMTLRAQTTVFTYQGRLTDSQTSGSGSYLMKFDLYADVGGNNLIDSIAGVPVQVSNNVFTVQLNFTANNAFDGTARFLKISVKRTVNENYTELNPLQPITSAPYSVRASKANTADTATNSLAVGGIPANQIIKEGDARLTDSRTPTAGSTNYVQNTATQQTGTTNFNISGSGTVGGTFSANLVRSATSFNIGNFRVLSIGGNNLFVGASSGASNTTGDFNSFVGTSAGFANTSGKDNSLFGTGTGQANTTGSQNSFFGTGAGASNLTGGENSFFGAFAGFSNSTAGGNSFFGRDAGKNTTEGAFNSYFGAFAGSINSTGNRNSFFGFQSGYYNSTGSSNSYFGYWAGANGTTGGNNSFFGKTAGQANQTGNDNTFIGTGAGLQNRTGNDNVFVGENTGGLSFTGNANSFFGAESGLKNNGGSNNTLIGYQTDVSTSTLNFATAVGAGAKVGESNAVVLGRPLGEDKVTIPGALFIGLYGTGGNAQLCVDTSNNRVSTCGSSLRYKENFASFDFGLNLINRLRPVSFNWKSSKMRDLGFVAEEVAAVEPLLANYDQNGQVEGVKYDRLSVVFVNAFKEQQKQIEAQQKQIDELKQIVCSVKPDAAVCKTSDK